MNLLKASMKRTIGFGILLFGFAIVSCNSEPKDGLEGMIAERDSLKSVSATLQARIAELDMEIARLDTTISHKLVTVMTTDTQEFKHFFEVYGNVESDMAATLYAESGGTVQSILVEEGERVQKGQTIVKQDTELIDRNIAEVRTSLELAVKLFEKQQRLWSQNVGSEVQYLEAKNRKESLESSLATLNEQRNKATVRAPYAGVIDKIYPKVGELLGMQSPVARIVNLNKMYVTADVTERYITDISENDQVDVIINRRDTISTKVSRLGKYINPANRTFELRVDIPEGNEKLRPNSLVVLKINDYSEPGALVIPSSLIMQDGEGNDYVFVIESDEYGRKVAQKRMIKTGYAYAGRAVVKSGIEPGEEIIDQGARSVRAGDIVEITTI
jgi:RND family efflux transporter MFP subunit